MFYKIKQLKSLEDNKYKNLIRDFFFNVYIPRNFNIDDFLFYMGLEGSQFKGAKYIQNYYDDTKILCIENNPLIYHKFKNKKPDSCELVFGEWKNFIHPYNLQPDVAFADFCNTPQKTLSVIINDLKNMKQDSIYATAFSFTRLRLGVKKYADKLYNDIGFKKNNYHNNDVYYLIQALVCYIFAKTNIIPEYIIRYQGGSNPKHPTSMCLMIFKINHNEEKLSDNFLFNDSNIHFYDLFKNYSLLKFKKYIKKRKKEMKNLQLEKIPSVKKLNQKRAGHKMVRTKLIKKQESIYVSDISDKGKIDSLKNINKKINKKTEIIDFLSVKIEKQFT